MNPEELFAKASELRSKAADLDARARALKQAESMRFQAAALTAQADKITAAVHGAEQPAVSQQQALPSPIEASQDDASEMSFEDQVNRSFHGPHYDTWRAGQAAMNSTGAEAQ